MGRSNERYGRAGRLGTLILVAFVALMALGGGSSTETAPIDPAAGPPRVRARVTRVIDGDTVRVRIGGRSEDVRYIGIDTPETVKPGTPVQCYGPQAHRLNQRLVAGRRVRLVFDAERRDVYHRLLAYVYVGRRLINAALVRRGYARSLTIPPNDTRAGLFHRLARAAGKAGRGLWGAC